MYTKEGVFIEFSTPCLKKQGFLHNATSRRIRKCSALAGAMEFERQVLLFCLFKAPLLFTLTTDKQGFQ